jgi:molecular chaperone GrpE
MLQTPRAPSGRDPEPDDEIEILEVVGLDDDTAAPAAAEGRPDPAAAEPSGPPEDRERYLRLLADFDNYKRQSERQRDREREQATACLVGRLLPVLDNLERALALSPSADHEESLRDGLILIFRQVLDELRKEGLEAIEAVGRPFDPQRHEALDTQPVPAAGHNTVTDELQRGYLFRGRLLRPSRVRVGLQRKAPEE